MHVPLTLVGRGMMDDRIKEAKDLVTVLCLLALLAIGGVLSVMGVREILAQDGPPRMTCTGDQGSICAEGEFCFLFICWDIENYWEDAGPTDRERCKERYGESHPCQSGSVW